MAYTRYNGENNVYDTSTGKIVTYQQAQDLGLFAPGKIQDIKGTNPYAGKITAESFAGSNLTAYEKAQIGGSSAVKVDATGLGTGTVNIPDFVADYTRRIADRDRMAAELGGLASPGSEEIGLSNQINDLEQGLKMFEQDLTEEGISVNAQSGLYSSEQKKAQIREQTLALRLQAAQQQRQGEYNVLKAKIDAAGATADDMLQLATTLKNWEMDAAQLESTLNANQTKLLDNILTSTAGMSWDSLSPDTVAQITTLAGKLGLGLDVVRNRMRLEAAKVSTKNSSGVLSNDQWARARAAGIPDSLTNKITQLLLSNTTLEDIRTALRADNYSISILDAYDRAVGIEKFRSKYATKDNEDPLDAAANALIEQAIAGPTPTP